MTGSPFFSIVVPVYNSDLHFLQEAIDSVRSQAFTDWELILIDDASPEAEIVPFLRQQAALEPRIVVVEQERNGGISVASNAGLAVARGEFVGLLDHDDLLAAGALREVAEALAADPEIDYLYTDEDKVDELGEFSEAFFKPDWSPERLRNQMYTSHFSVYRRALIEQVGGFRSEFDGSQDHDLALRVTEIARTVHHLPHVLYHWRIHPQSTAASGEAKPYAWDAGVRAVDAHVRRTGTGDGAVRGPWQGTVEVTRHLDPARRVSVVIPTRGGGGVVHGAERCFVVEAVRGLRAHTAHENLEIVIVHDVDTPAAVLDELRAVGGEGLVLVPYDKPFNFSEKCNLGAVHSTGDILVMLNDDTEPISDRVIEDLCAPLEQHDVGMTGGYLVFEEGLIQHAGHQYAHRGYGHPYQDFKRDDPGPFCALDVDREVSGVTAACAALRREVFFEIGGFTEELPINFNDVDLSLKVRAAGYRILWISRARMYHFESRTRERRVDQVEVDIARARWGIPEQDAYMHLRTRTTMRKERAGLV